MNENLSDETRRKINLAFKKTVVDYYQNHDHSMRDVARKFEITPGMLSKWVQKYGNLENLLSGDNNLEIQAELSILRGEVAVLKNLVKKYFVDKNESWLVDENDNLNM